LISVTCSAFIACPFICETPSLAPTSRTPGIQVGFRSVAVSPRDGALLLNGCPIKLRGFNRHEFNAWKGIGAFSSFPFPSLTPAPAVVGREAAPTPTDASSSSSKREAIRDVLMIKQSNFNAIRISHYPNDAFFYLLCDHLGDYVIDEANIETVYIDRLESMVEWDKNHACILMWSLGTRHNHHFRSKEGWLSMTHVKPEPGLTCVDGGQATRAGSDAT
jgi:beta-galactosidase